MLKKAMAGQLASRIQGSPGHASYSLHGTLTPQHGSVVDLHC